jgi:hypothetical protein
VVSFDPGVDMSKKKSITEQPTPFAKFEAAAKRILSIPKNDFDKVLQSRPRRPKKPAGGSA